MPRYFFNMVDGERVEDDSGTTLTDDKAAFLEAIRFAGMSLASEPQLIVEHLRFGVEVMNDRGQLLFVVNASAEMKKDVPDLSTARSIGKAG